MHAKKSTHTSIANFSITCRYFDVLKFQRNISSLQPLVSHWLPYFNSALNPIIYNFMSGKCYKATASMKSFHVVKWRGKLDDVCYL